ncbi:pentapeptide repeat-containing protein, partial [Elioraea rosea]|uniref:pentapeptide repeat-containing protein n=1 Tax=Elioraea rosea TaxID=2492390 RepID=UPI00118532FC
MPTARTDAAPAPRAPDADLGELLAAANDAARREVSQQWFFFITLMLLLAASVGTTTHRALLDAAPMRLPILNIDLPMLGYYAIAPTIFVVLHFYALLQVNALRGKVTEFVRAAEEEARALEAAGHGAYSAILERLVRPLDGFAVVQAIAAPRLHRRALAARVMTAITLVIGPVLLLVFFLLRFLPYQDVPTTHWHRALVAIDILILWSLMPPAGLAARAAAALGSLGLLAFCLMVATVRGEALDRPWPVAQELRARLFFDGALDPKTNRPPSLPFSRVLSLADEKLIRQSETELAREMVARTIVLRERSLRGAILIATDLRKADLSRADLAGARLDGAWLHGAFLLGAHLEGAVLDGAVLRDAAMHGASLTGASLRGARLEGAGLDGATLAAAVLDDARLHAATLANASLEGASLVGATLRGAFLTGAKLQGASLISADLRGADLRFVQAWRADAFGARLGDADGRNLHIAELPAGWNPAGATIDASPWDSAVSAWLAAIADPDSRTAAVRRLSALTAGSADDPGLDMRHAALAALAAPDPRAV